MNQSKNCQTPRTVGRIGLLNATIVSALLALAYPFSGATQEVGIYFVHTDHLGTPQKLTDESGTIVWEADYSPFGDGSLQVSAVTNNLRSPGQYFDAETGLHYNYFRDYDTSSGRYLQSDPIGLSDGQNAYAYVHGNPINAYDPNGQNAVWAVRGGWTIGRVIVNPAINSVVYWATGTASLGVFLYNVTHKSEDVDWDEIQKDIDYQNYHRACDRPPPPGLDPCQEAKWRYRQALKCQRLREEWEERWGDSRTQAVHARALVNVKARLRKAAEDIAKFCSRSEPPACPN